MKIIKIWVNIIYFSFTVLGYGVLGCYGMRAVSAYLGELILLLFSPYNLEQIISTIKVHKKSEKFMLGPFQFYSSKFSFSIVRPCQGGEGQNMRVPQYLHWYCQLWSILNIWRRHILTTPPCWHINCQE